MSGRCAREATGHPTIAPPKRVRNLRRLIVIPGARKTGGEIETPLCYASRTALAPASVAIKVLRPSDIMTMSGGNWRVVS
jgi:hypothetical protein